MPMQADEFSYKYSRPSATCRGCGVIGTANCHPRATIAEFAQSLPDEWTYYPQNKVLCPACTESRPAVEGVDWNLTAKSLAAARVDKALEKTKKADRYDGTY